MVREFNNLEEADYEPPLEQDWILTGSGTEGYRSDLKHLKVYEERLIEAGSKSLRDMTGKYLVLLGQYHLLPSPRCDTSELNHFELFLITILCIFKYFLKKMKMCFF